MLFNSIEFFLFLPIVFVLYWFVFNKSLRIQNLLVLLSSYIFYGWWDFRFLALIFISTVCDYLIGLYLASSVYKKRKKILLLCSIFINLSLLGFFKYYNFFIESWINFSYSLGYEIKNVWALSIILPVGISFYTFQTMSYTIDIYRNKLSPTKDFISFASFVSFFPQLVAGPIERASNLLPQILKKRNFSYEQGIQGFRLIVWGLFKKVVVADKLAPIVENIFSNYQDFEGGTLWLGVIYFAFQIYCDFSGYSDIAIGLSKLFGIELMSNFKFPYFSRNIGEFWRRWHISLSSWFRDYIYIPLGGSKKGKWKSIRNILIIFIISGFWHGANWTFIFWGLYHSILFIPSFIFKANRKFVNSVVAENGLLPSLRETFQVLVTFLLITIGWVFFRNKTLNDSFEYLSIMFSSFSLKYPFDSVFIYITILISLEYLIRREERLKADYFKFDWVIFLILSLLIYLDLGSEKQFIYFQF